MYLNDAVQQPDIVSIGGSCEERCYAVSDLLRHTLRTHTVVLQEQLDTTYKPGMNRDRWDVNVNVNEVIAANILSDRLSCR